MKNALAATANKRGTLARMKEAMEVFEEIEHSSAMEKLWSAYQKNFNYAVDISWHKVMDSVRALYVCSDDAS